LTLTQYSLRIRVHHAGGNLVSFESYDLPIEGYDLPIETLNHLQRLAQKDILPLGESSACWKYLMDAVREVAAPAARLRGLLPTFAASLPGIQLMPSSPEQPTVQRKVAAEFRKSDMIDEIGSLACVLRLRCRLRPLPSR
jgi:hypothetical protein